MREILELSSSALSSSFDYPLRIQTAGGVANCSAARASNLNRQKAADLKTAGLRYLPTPGVS